MARIALRAYNREIEHLIEGGQIEEAVAHCRHIFKYFPKHINTYRLLGKAYLETQRYGDAADILQRVLSSIPDDFISHLGMSIIREDEGNLDEAIWHMERAFEVQPANRAIQDELRRLYGRRDGLEPPKIRLTRGALARMYAKGDLYQQAIAELRAALAEDPQRLDLQVVLADVYGRAGQRVEAASICNGLLRKLPYCLIANQVMADILADSERSEDARVYRQRSQALDAYLAHVSPGAPTPDKVPDIAVSLERLDWQPGKSIEGSDQPDWAASLGVELESGATQKEEVPDWLSAVQADTEITAIGPGSETSSPFTDLTGVGADWSEDSEDLNAGEWPEDQESGAAQISSAEEIPEWMKAAGWSPATGEAEEGPTEFDFDDEDYAAAEPAGELEAANLPDWLKEIAPENLDQDTSAATDEASWDQSTSEDAAILQDTPDWFKESEIDETEEDQSSDWLAGLGGAAAAGVLINQTEETSDEMPDWLKEMEAEEGAAAEDQIPDWLTESEADASAQIEESVPEKISPAEEIPDWLQEMEVEEAAGHTDQAVVDDSIVPEREPASEIPDWLAEMDAETADEIAAEPEVKQTPEDSEEIPDWLQEMEIEEIEAEPSAELPDWILEAEPKTESNVQPEPAVEEPETSETMPGWLADSTPDDVTETSKIEIEEDAIPTEELQPWMIEDEEAITDEMIAELAAEPAEEIPDWLKEMEEEGPEAIQGMDLETGLELEAEAMSDEGMSVVTPDWSAQAESIDKSELPVQGEEVELEIPEETSSIESAENIQSEDMDADEAFAWLESLAAKQGADEQGFLLTPEERIETPPDWVQAAVDTESGVSDESIQIPETPIDLTQEQPAADEGLTVEKETQPEAELQEFQTELDTVPEWLQEEGEAAEESVSTQEPLPDWLQETGETLESEIAEPEATAEPAEDIPEWLKTMEMEDEETAHPKAEEVLPDWLQEPSEEFEAADAKTETLDDKLAELEEPIIAEDTKPTRLAIAHEEEQTSQPEESPTLMAPTPEITEELQPETEIPEQPPEVKFEPTETGETEIDADDGFAWLESLAAKQGADEGMLLSPEERLETPPEWIQSALDKQFGEVETQEPTEDLDTAEEAMAAEPELPALEEIPETPVSAEETPDLPDWLSDIEAETGSDETADVMDAIVDSSALDEVEPEIPELPSWLADAEEAEAPDWTPPEPPLKKLDLNQASLAELERLPGIGFIMAQKIITYRDQNGLFSNVIDLQQIPGFSPAMLHEIEEMVIVETTPEEPISLPVESSASPELAEARQEARSGLLDEALDKYSELILHKQSLDEVIYDLNQILLRHGNDAAVWQTLGDAQMRANQVQDALESYRKAEQLFR